jgi:prepilin-type N-terminal cleavage/methylation domain-containing protein
MAKRATSATGSRGFTLLELLVVLTVMVLIAAAWPLASAHVFAAQHLRNESQRLLAAIRSAQMTARLTGVTQDLVIAKNGNSYQVGTEAHDLYQGMTLRLRSESGGGAGAQFRLFPDGSAHADLLDLSTAQHTATIRVLPVTGHLELDL